MPKNRDDKKRTKKVDVAKSIANKGRTLRKFYQRVEVILVRFMHWFSKWVDKILFNARYGKFIALILAVVFYGMVDSINSNESLFASVKNAKTLSSVPVEAIYSPQLYEVEGIPETVSVTVMGDSSDLVLMNQQGNFKVKADLTDLTEGEHEVSLVPANFSDKVEVKVTPESVNVTITKKEMKLFGINAEFINASSMENIYSLGEVTFDQNEVYVRASQEKLDQVAFVKALIDVKGQTSDFESEAQLAAYDINGDRMDIDIVPETVKASVKVSAPSKELPIRVIPVGTIKDGKAIESITMDITSIVVYGPQSVLDKMDVLELNVPAESLENDKEIVVPVMRPNGINRIDTKNVTIKVTLGEASEKTVDKIPISITGGLDGYSYKLSKDTISLSLTGSDKLLESVDANQIHVFADVESINDKEGTQTITLRAYVDQSLVTYILDSETIQVEVKKK